MISLQMLKEISEMNEADLLDLHRQVVATIKYKRSHEAVRKASTFNVGDQVSFISGRTGRKVGEIVKRNPRKAVVAVKNPFAPVNHVKWSVPYEMLTKVK